MAEKLPSKGSAGIPHKE